MINVTWNEIDIAIDHMAEKIKQSENKYDNIYGIPRGGLIVAGLLSYAVDIPIILDIRQITPNTIICDDIVDSGKTLSKLLIHFSFAYCNNFPIAALVNNKCNTTWNVMYCGIKNDSNDWINFPWDKGIDTVSKVTIDNRYDDNR